MKIVAKREVKEQGRPDRHDLMSQVMAEWRTGANDV